MGGGAPRPRGGVVSADREEPAAGTAGVAATGTTVRALAVHQSAT